MTFEPGTAVIVDNDPTQRATVRYADFNDPRKPPVAYSLMWDNEILRVSAHRVSEDYPEEEFYDPEPVTRGFCDGYEVHEPHVYVAINQNLYSCPGLTQEQLDEMDAYDPGTCEHGLSADLCSGPMHY